MGLGDRMLHIDGPADHVRNPPGYSDGQVDRAALLNPPRVDDPDLDAGPVDKDLHLRAGLHPSGSENSGQGEKVDDEAEDQDRNPDVNLVHVSCRNSRENSQEIGPQEWILRRSITVFLLLPQFVLSGMVEALAAVAIMEFLTTQKPESMRTVAGAIFFLSLSIASYIGSFLVNMIHIITGKNENSPWLGGHDLNKNRLENYYSIIAAVSAINFVFFTFFGSQYVELSSPRGRDKRGVVSRLEFLPFKGSFRA